MGRGSSVVATTAVATLAGLAVLTAIQAFRQSERREPDKLSEADSAFVSAQYWEQLSARGNAAAVPDWLSDIHIARLQSAALRSLGTDARASGEWTIDSLDAVFAEDAKGGYLRAMLAEDGDFVLRWQSRMEPISVWVQPHSNARGFSRGLVAPARRGFSVWNELQLGVEFAMVDDSTLADVHVLWSAEMPQSSQIGTTFRMTGSDGWIAFAQVVLSTSYDVYAVQNAARHEAGHVLGLGHSPDPRDIMTAVSEGKQYQLTEADRRTASLLYRLPPGEVGTFR